MNKNKAQHLSFVNEWFNEVKSEMAKRPDGLRDLLKLHRVYSFMKEKELNPKLKQRQLCQSIGVSPNTLKRDMMDLGIKSIYRYDISAKHISRKTDKSNVVANDINSMTTKDNYPRKNYRAKISVPVSGRNQSKDYEARAKELIAENFSK